jgi:hypothetical protein
MGYATNWDEWDNLHLILDQRLSGFLRFIKNFVMDGYGLSDPSISPPPTVEIGKPGLNFAYCNGYELKQTDSVFAPLVDATTNYIYLHFTKTVDPGGGYSAIAIDITVNQTGIDPGDAIKLGEVDTLAGVITAIREENNKYKIHTSQLDEDIDGNLHHIGRLTLQKGVAFPATPAPQASELYFRTDLGQLYVYDGAVWQALTPGPPPGVLLFFSSVPVLPGDVVIFSAPNTVSQGLANTIPNSQVIGVAQTPIFPGPIPGQVLTWQGQTTTAFFEPGLALAPGQDVFLSNTIPGALTNVPPLPGICVQKKVGIISDPTAYAPANLYAIILLQIDHSVKILV